MFKSRDTHNIFFCSLLISLAMSYGYSSNIWLFVKVAITNFIFIFIINSYTWRLVKGSILKAYGIPDYVHEDGPSQKFAGIPLIEEDPFQSKEEFLRISQKNRSKIINYLRNLITYAVYSVVHVRFIAGPETNYSSLIFSSILIFFLININFWGQVLLSLFIALIAFSIQIKFKTLMDYSIFFWFISLFFYCLVSLTSWYWSQIGLSKLRQNYLEMLKRIFPIVFLFLTVFSVCDYFIDPNKNFIDQLLQKINSQKGLKTKLASQASKNSMLKLTNDPQTPIKLSKVEEGLKERLEKKTAELVNLSNKPEFSDESIKEYKELLVQQQNISDKLNKRIQNRIKASGKAKNELNHEQAEKFLSLINNKKHLTPSQLMKLQDIRTQKQELKSLLNSGIQTSNKDITKRKNQLIKLTNSLQKDLGSSLGRSETTSEFKDIIDKHEKMSSKKVEGDLESLKKSTKENLLLGKRIKEEIKQIKSSPLPNEFNLAALEKINNQNKLEILKKVQLKEKIQNEKHIKLVQTKKEKKKNYEKLKRIIISLSLFLISIFIVNFLNKLFSKKELYTKRSKLTNEQKTKISALLSKKSIKFASFHEEINYKFKQFYHFLSIVFYEPDFPPPPSLVITEIENIPVKGFRISGHQMSSLFNLINYADQKKITKDDIKKFRKSYNSYLKSAKKLL